MDIFISNFENDNWGLDGYVSTSWRTIWSCLRGGGSTNGCSFQDNLGPVCTVKTQGPHPGLTATSPLHHLTEESSPWDEKDETRKKLATKDRLSLPDTREPRCRPHPTVRLGLYAGLSNHPVWAEKGKFQMHLHSLLCKLTLCFCTNSSPNWSVNSLTWHTGDSSCDTVSFTWCRLWGNSYVCPPSQRILNLWKFKFTTVFEIKMRQSLLVEVHVCIFQF